MSTSGHCQDDRPLKSKTEWGRLGRAVRSGEYPSEYRNGEYCKYGVYALGQTQAKRARKAAVPVTVDLLKAIRTVSRAAKRYRDAASSCYERRAYRFATANSGRKAELYDLKDRGISSAWREGRIAPVSVRGSLTEYRDLSGEYCFHSYLRPREWHFVAEPPGVPLYVEARLKASEEARLADAEFTLASLPTVNSVGFVVGSPPVLGDLREPGAVAWGGDDDDNDDDRSGYGRR